MGDRAPAQVVIWATTPKDVPVILEFLEEWGLGAEWSTLQAPEGSVFLGTTYGADDTNIGMVYDQNLAANAPNTAFTMWVDPKYEYPGELEIHVPGLGSFRSSCDANGNPTVTPEAIMKVIDDAGDHVFVSHIRPKLAELTGAKWLEAIEAMDHVADATVAGDFRGRAHLEPSITDVDEDSTRGADIRFQAVCRAEASGYACGWAGPWRHADEYVDQANPTKELGTDPGQLAYQAAEADARQHLEDEGVEL